MKDRSLAPLTCLQCGAPLEMRGSALTVHCSYCGAAQAVTGDLAEKIQRESWVICPVCQRNDRLVKVTARGSFGQDARLASLLTLPEPIYHDLTPPSPAPVNLPTPSVDLAYIAKAALLGLIGLFVAWIFLRAESALLNYVCAPLTCLLSLLLLGQLFLIPQGLRERAQIYLAREQQKQAGQEYRRQRAQFEQEYSDRKQANERMKREHEQRLKIWEQMYYCFRDDCVCLPAEGLSAPVEKMAELIEARQRLSS